MRRGSPGDGMRLVWLFCALLFASVAHAQTTAVVSPPEKARYFDNNGVICSGCLVFSYAGGTSTPIATYTDSTGGTPNTNPVTLDSTGQANIWFLPTTTYKISLSPAGDLTNSNPFWTVDNVSVASPIPIPIANNKLQNSSVTIAGHTVALGGSTTLQASDLTNGVSGASGAILLLQGSPSNNQVPVWNGTQWVPTILPGLPVNSQSTSYSVQPADCGKRIIISGVSTLTLPGTGGFAAACTVWYTNSNSSTGIIMSGFPSPQFYILWPGQSGAVVVVGGSWNIVSDPGRWRTTGAAFFMDSISGSDTLNDGLAAGRAFRTIQHCYTIATQQVDTPGSGPSCTGASGDLFTECDGLFGPLPQSASFVLIQGAGSGITWRCGGSVPLSFGDLGTIIVDNIAFGGGTETGIFLAHNQGILDVGLPGTCGSALSLIGNVGMGTMISDNGGNANIGINCSLTVTGGYNELINMSYGGTVSFGNLTLTFQQAASSVLLVSNFASRIIFPGTMVFSPAAGNALYTSMKKFVATANGVIFNGSGVVIPGGVAGTVSTGGQECGEGGNPC